MIFIKFFTASFLLFILVSCSSEPEPNPIVPAAKGTIRGFVQEANTNTPIYYATVTTNPRTKEILTNIDGSFTLTEITAGDYVVYAYQEGYDSDSAFVSVVDKDTTTANLSLVNFSEYLDYYPLDIGNYWEYWTTNLPIFSLEVISDTLISGRMYKVVERTSLNTQAKEFKYERVDNYNAVVYRYFPQEEKEMMIDSLPTKQGQRFTSNMFLEWGVCTSYCSKIEEANIFGEIRKLRYLSHDCGQDLPFYQILKGIGLYSYGWPRPPSGVTLKYAIINGVEYGGR